VSLIQTENGVAPWVWNPNASRADSVCHFDVDADPTIDPADTIQADASNVANRFELKYAYSRRVDRYTHTARIGARRVETTSRARHRLILTRGASDPGRIHVIAREAGSAGTGITVVCTVGAPPLSVTDNATTRTVTITVESGVDTPQNIVDAINAGSALIEAETDDENVNAYNGVDTSSVSLLLPDFGTVGSLVCARSQAQCSTADLPGPNAGVRLHAVETRLLYDHGSAARWCEWNAAAYALPHERLELLAPEEEYGWLEPGDDITVSWDGQHLDERVGVVEGMDFYSDGRVGFRFVFIDTGSSRAAA
jgi:hypothetical protein